MQFTEVVCVVVNWMLHCHLLVNLVHLLTARPWAERGSCSARDLFFVVFILSVTRPKLPLDQIAMGTSDHTTWDVYSPKAVETSMYRKYYGYCFLYYVKIFFLLVSSKRWVQREFEDTKKRYYVSHGMR